MNNNDIFTPTRQDCPYFPELLENRKLRHELEYERKRRVGAEANSVLALLSGLLAGTFLSGSITVLIVNSGMGHGTAEAYARLFVSLGFAFLGFSFALLGLNTFLSSIIRRHNERKKYKNELNNNEENDHV